MKMDKKHSVRNKKEEKLRKPRSIIMFEFL